MFFEDEPLTSRKVAVRKWLQTFVDDFNIERAEKEYSYFTDDELIKSVGKTLVFDVESYVNYFLCSFRCVETRKIVYFEETADIELDRAKLRWILQNFCVIGFNSMKYDMLILTLALLGRSRWELKEATNDIILGSLPVRAFEQKYACKVLRCNHIDLIEVAPLKASLKAYAARLHTQRLQELPFPHDAQLTQKEATVVRFYNFNDLDNTIDLLLALMPQLELRAQLSREYKQDLHSRSDAQIAEHVITSELSKLNGYRAKKPDIPAGTKYKYKLPPFISYQSDALKNMLSIVTDTHFQLSPEGYVLMPDSLSNLKLQINKGIYKLGMGGLHSTETCVAHKSDDKTLLIDKDVASYYPAIILNSELYPKHLGRSFLQVYRSIVNRRLEAKHSGNKIVADSLKITINGSFGKLGNCYSALYSPDLLIQVTITGQLALLMLIEMIEGIGIQVISANTDGIVIKCPKDRNNELQIRVIHWEKLTGFTTEETRYKAVYSRDVNNYIAIKEDDTAKVKGTYSEKGSALNSVLSKNPENLICNDAVIANLIKNTSIEETIRSCKDIRRFVTVRTVKGGAEKSGVYLGKTVRWYYSTKAKGEINYVISGNKVPNSEGSMPLMDLPSEFPTDIDYKRYIEKAYSILDEIGCTTKMTVDTLF